MTKPKPPCKDCVERIFKCHAGCKEYGEYLRQNEKYKEFLKNEKNKEFVNYKSERWDKK